MIAFDAARMQPLRDELRRMGCPSELSHVESLVAIDVPPEVSGPSIREWLRAREDAGEIDVEEADIDW